MHRCLLIPAGIFLFILPFNHTVAVRLTSLVLATFVAILAWRRDPPPPLPLKLPILVWCAFALVSLFWTVDFAYSIGEIKNEIGYTVVAFLVFYSVTKEDFIWSVWNGILLASFAVMFALGAQGVVSRGGESWPLGGLQGGVGTFSTYLVTIFPFILLTGLRASRGGVLKNQAWLTVPLFFSVAAALTSNRAVWPAFIAQLLIFGGFYWRDTTWLGGRGWIAAATTILIVVAAFQFTDAVQRRTALGLQTSPTFIAMGEEDPRAKIWSGSWKFISEKPVTGYGFGRGILRKTLQAEFDNKLFWHGHNIVLNYTLELGLGGAAVILLLFFTIGREFWKLTGVAEPELRQLGAAGLALVAGVFLKNMTDDFFVRENALLFWALVGMSLGYAKRRSLAKPA
jgi:O-antigen ligase